MPSRDAIISSPTARHEVETVRWVEKVITPLLVFGIMALTTCMYDTTQAVELLKIETRVEGESRKQMTVTVEDIEVIQRDMALKINTIETNQAHLLNDLEAVKAQSLMILEILQKSGK